MLMNVVRDKKFTKQELKGEDFDDCSFVSCKFSEVNLRFTGFDNCKFEGCDFSGVMFDMTSFIKCSFSGSKLSNLDFSEVGIKECDFSEAVIKNSIFHQRKKGSKFEKSVLDLRSCKFNKTNLFTYKSDFFSIESTGRISPRYKKSIKAIVQRNTSKILYYKVEWKKVSGLKLGLILFGQ